MASIMSSKCKCSSETKPRHIYGVDPQLFRAEADVRAGYRELVRCQDHVFVCLQELSWTSICVEICARYSSEDIGCLELQRDLIFWHSVIQREVNEHRHVLQKLVNWFFKLMETSLLKALELQLEGTHDKACREVTICDESDGQQSLDPQTSVIAYIEKCALKGSEHYRESLRKIEILRNDIIYEFNGFIQLLLRDKYRRGTNPMLERMETVYDSLRPRERKILQQLYVLSAMQEAKLELQRKKQAAGIKGLKKQNHAHKSYISSEIIVESGEIKGRKITLEQVPNSELQSDCYRVTRYYSR